MSVRVERVIVGVDGSPGSIAALRQAAREAIQHGAELRPILAWTPPGGEKAHSAHTLPRERYHQWRAEARQRLARACETALGDLRDQVHTVPIVIRSNPGRVLVTFAHKPTDMLVVGVGGHHRLHRLLRGSARRYCLRHARCPVLVVRPQPCETPAEHHSRPHRPGRTSSSPMARITPVDALSGYGTR